MKIAIIYWTDSALHGTNQLNEKDKSLCPMKAFSCGLLVKQDKHGITIATDYWGDGEWRNCETIYRKQIDHLEIKEIKYKKAKDFSLKSS